LFQLFQPERLRWTKTYRIYAKFDNISGLTRKTKVKIAGINIGVLRGVSLDDSKVKLKLLIRKNIFYTKMLTRVLHLWSYWNEIH
jgi:ABC-type transporter Mla subunit MlaD